MLVLSGNENKVRAQLSALRMELGNRLGLRKGNEFAPLWVIDFPLLEWDEDTQRYHAMHHPLRLLSQKISTYWKMKPEKHELMLTT